MIYRPYVLTSLIVVVLTALAQAQTFTTLYAFTGGSDGGFPRAGVIQDQAGTLYGTTSGGGDPNCNAPYACGVAYQVNAAGSETVLHGFSGSDGRNPEAPVSRDRAGSIYGTTWYGGSADSGTIFKIDTTGIETVLHSFTASDGCWPFQGVIRDKSGSWYGTTYTCGSSSYGTIFKVNSVGKFTLLHTFAGGLSDGNGPMYGHLAMDKAGNFYGTTMYGGSGGCYDGHAHGCGVLYKLTPQRKLKVLYSFTGGTSDGCGPVGSVVQDTYGNFYGTTSACGSHNAGTIWKVSTIGKKTILHNFAGGTSDGCYPQAGVVRDSKGNLYGVTDECGANGYGALYKVNAKGRLTLLHSFENSDGAYPYGEVLRTGKGTVFGTTYWGGDLNCDTPHGCGTVWSYVP